MTFWPVRKHLIWIGAVLLLCSAIGAAFGHLVPRTLAPASVSAQDRALPRVLRVAPSLLEELRQASLLGDEAAIDRLATLLLDRYDLDGDNDDLFEAVVWIDRDLYSTSNVALAKRISSRHCDHRILQWHALCHSGE